MNKTAIDWCDRTWNPVTGCLHDCPYCYARKIAQRYCGYDYDEYKRRVPLEKAKPPYILDAPKYVLRKNGLQKAPFPHEFAPTLYRYRLDEPAALRNPQTIFVGSMCDLFGDWVPDAWIQEVFAACARAPQHRYLFLTKNPDGYWRDKPLPTGRNLWYGVTVTNNTELRSIAQMPLEPNRFVSMEPLQDPVDLDLRPVRAALPFADWVILGAETGNRKGKRVPERGWIERIVEQCRAQKVPVFMKESLRTLMGNDITQEYPWDCDEKGR